MVDSHCPAEAAPPREQLVYANLLIMGVWTGVFVLTVTYVIYLTGVLPEHVPMSEISAHWDQGVSEYLAETDSPSGWGWLNLLGKGDFLNYVGFAVLGLTTVVCYVLLLIRIGKGDSRLFCVIAALEILVLGLAASGLLGSGGH